MMKEYINSDADYRASSKQQSASAKDQIDDLFNLTRDYIEDRIELYKLRAINKTCDVLSDITSKCIVWVAALFFIIMLNFGIALFLGHLFGKTYYGFLTMAGFYLVIWLIFRYTENKWFKTPMMNILIKKFF